MAYEVHLKEFDGPLDLLLHLIEEAQVDIKDVFVSEITNQYLALMDEIDELDMENASEFLTVAATLVYIKSRSLLPKPPAVEEDEEDPEVVLMRQLKDYKRFKDASKQLAAMVENMNGVFSKLPEEFAFPPQEYSLGNVSCRELAEAFMNVMKNDIINEGILERSNVSADTYTVRNQLVKIREKLRESISVIFDELFEQTSDKMEKIVTFMALLEMIARQEIILKQKVPYGKITITAVRLIEDDNDYEFMDETD